MATAAAGKMEKKKEEQDVRQIINDIINQALASKNGFKPETVKQYEIAGQKNREEKGRQQMLESVPSRPLGKMVVSKSSPNEMKKEISPHMTEAAIEKSMDLAEVLELAALEGRKMNLRQWVKGS